LGERDGNESELLREETHMTSVNALREELNRMANLQFATPEFERLLSVRLTLPRARFYIKHNAYYNKNRRDCWGFVLGAAPLDVKKLVWKHEEDELITDKREGEDHYSLVVRQAQMVGVTREEIEQSEPIPGARAAQYAWLHIARNRPWLEAFTSSTMLERRNNGEIIKGGGLSARIAKRWVEDLGVSIEKAPSLKVHAVADVEHADMMWEIFENHAASEEAQRGVLSAAHDCMEIDRAYRGALADAMLRID
jgi:pyrroloquinoline quinone (PQQ) biosynthesis protein C